MRETVILAEGWKFIREDAGPTPPQTGRRVTLPHTWNAIDGQDGGNDYYRGACWYYKELPEVSTDKEAYLEFSGAAMSAEVYLNGEKLFEHRGGYSTFRVNITEGLKSGGSLAVRVDNGVNEEVYPQAADFTFYGGLYRPVSLITVEKEHFSLDYFGAPGIAVTPELKDGFARVKVRTWSAGGEEVLFSLGSEKKTARVESGMAEAEFVLENPHLWQGREDPYLYEVSAELRSGEENRDEISARFGVREFYVDPNKGFILNGKPYPLRGVARHQDREGVGNALTPQMHEEDLSIIMEMGANFIRLAHYQHAQEFYDLCDENGILVWAEIPYITRHMDGGEANTLSQMKELVLQNYNHPSIICWGLSNEITFGGGITDALLENHRKLNDLCHKLDPTRPTSMAHVSMQPIDGEVLNIADLNSYNLYFGWYGGELEQNEEFLDKFHDKYPDKPIGLSEYGADANPRFQTAKPERSDYTEEYQAVYHEHILKVIDERPFVWMSSVWNMFDFGADGRDEGGAHGRNQKGLVTMDRKTRKDAFYLYKAYWSKEPFVHICGRRYVDRTESETEVKVYSNLSKVRLYLDGADFAEQEGEHIFRFKVPITGDHGIIAVAGDQTDEIRIRHTDAPNPNYSMPGKKVRNWYTPSTEGCFTLEDKLEDVYRSPEASALLEKLTQKASASMGDVAKGSQDNPMVRQMMARSTLNAMLLQAGDRISDEDAEEFVKAITKIKKPE